MKRFILTLFCLNITTLTAEAPITPSTTEETSSKRTEVSKVSEAFGHLIGKNLESMGMKFDIAKVIQGLQDSYDGKTAPMSEADCIQAITTAQELVFKENASTNLKKAEQFLEGNQIFKDIQSLENGKLQYRIEQEGKGSIVDANSNPLIRYTGKLLDGSIFGASKEEELIHLDETISGFSKGLVGMKEGEKRTLFIHPDLGYGIHGSLPPNSLLTFEVEIIQANAPYTEALDSLSPTNLKSRENPEIAIPFEEPEVIR